MQNEIVIYTDGGCSGNPGPGGWAFVVQDGNGKSITNSGGEAFTTNNKMELTAVIEALRYIIEKYGDTAKVRVFTDSQYVKQGITSWIHNWKKNGWKTASKSPVKNKELWQALDSLREDLQIEWGWVKGHSGVELNELCDTLVGKEMQKYQK
ncbi:MAG: ribonuclease HI [Sphaerochaetaceae bacterium]|nr:ribonuclease HI [Sphaerochaetaceae bacterium]